MQRIERLEKVAIRKRNGLRLKKLVNSSKRGLPHPLAYLDDAGVWNYKCGLFTYDGVPIPAFCRRPLGYARSKNKQTPKKRKTTFCCSHKSLFDDMRPSEDHELSRNKHPYILVNVVRTVHMRINVNIYRVMTHFQAFQLEPKKFASVSLRIKPVTMILFPSGKLVITGARNELQGLRYGHYFMQIISKIPTVVHRHDEKTGEQWTELAYIGNAPACEKSEVQNMVASIPLDIPAIDLKALKEFLKEEGTWQPDLFPGLRYRMKEPKCTVLVFDSAKNVMMGLTTREDSQIAAEKVYNLVTPFRMETRSSDSHTRFQDRLRSVHDL